MKLPNPFVFFILTIVSNLSNGATIILDDFSSGPVSLGSSGDTRDIDTIVSPFADARITFGSGFPNWTSAINTQNGSLIYSLNIPEGNPEFNQHIALNYSSSLGNLNLGGFNSFVIHVEALHGTGNLMAFVGVGPTSGVIPVILNTTGDVVIPFTHMNAINPTNPSSIGFWIIPDNPDFSVTLSGISVVPVPEPSSYALMALGGVVLLLMRGRLRV